MTERAVANAAVSEAENELIFRAVIIPKLFGGVAPSDSPTLIVLGGQGGIGKSTATERILAEVDDGDSYVVINADSMREYYPGFEELLKRADPTGTGYAKPDATIWANKALRYAQDNGYNAVYDGTMRDLNRVTALMGQARERGHGVQAAIVAGPKYVSRWQILKRYLKESQHRGYGRYVARGPHDEAFDSSVLTVAAIERDRLADTLAVYAPGGAVLYSNRLDAAGDWVDTPAVVEAVERARAQRPSGKFVTDCCRTLRVAAATLRAPVWARELVDIGDTLPHGGATESDDASPEALATRLSDQFGRASRFAAVRNRAAAGPASQPRAVDAGIPVRAALLAAPPLLGC